MQDRVVEALFAAYFTQGADIGDHRVLADPGRAAAIVQQEGELRRQEFGGVPSFVLAGCFLFSGAQPVEAMVTALRDATAQIRAMQPQEVAD